MADLQTAPPPPEGAIAIAPPPPPPAGAIAIQHHGDDFIEHAGASTWDNVKGAFNLATGADLWNHAIESAKAGNYEEAAKALQGVVEGPASRIAGNLIDTAKVAAGHMKEAASKLLHGDTQGASDSANAGGLHMATVLAPHAEQAAENYKQGKYGAAAGDLTGDAIAYLAAKTIHAAPEAARATVDAVGSAASAVRNAADHPAAEAAIDALGIVHPGAASAIHLGKRLVRVAGKIKDAFSPDEQEAEASAPAADPNAPPEGVPQAWWDRLGPDQKQQLRNKLQPAAATPPPLPAGAVPITQAPAAAPAPPPTEYLDNASLIRAAEARRARDAAQPAPAAEPVTPAPALGRAAASTTSRPKTILNDVDAYLAQKRAERAAQTPPPGEPGEPSPPAATPPPPPPASPAAPAAAPPPYGKQYITPGQVTKYAAENGLAEDDAAAALEKQGVSVVDRSSTNRVLHAIGAELGYDHGTLSEIAHATYGQGLGKITHEQMMELAEKLGNEQATKEPLATKRTGSPADAAIAPQPEGSPLGGVVMDLPTGDIHADPVRFQYKAGMGQGGAGDELRGVTKFDPEKSGILSVWKDPADGKTYVVNGHHRLELAQRTGAQSLTVRYIDAATAAEARAKGAMINIAEGRGTSIDAAKVFRDSGATAEDLHNQGLSLTGSVAKEGQALANLDPNLFNQVVSGEMKPARGAMIGQVADHADQRQLVKLLHDREASGKPMTDGQLSELLRMQAPQVTETQHSLFGDDEISRSLIAEKAGVSDYIQSRLTQKRRTFNAVGNERAATRLAEAGNVIDADKNAAIAEATNQEYAVYQKLSTATGPVSDALDEAAKALHAGENPAIVKVRTYAKIEPILKREADKLTGRSGAPGERSKGSAQPRSDQAGRGKHDKGAEEAPTKISDLMR